MGGKIIMVGEDWVERRSDGRVGGGDEWIETVIEGWGEWVG